MKVLLLLKSLLAKLDSVNLGTDLPLPRLSRKSNSTCLNLSTLTLEDIKGLETLPQTTTVKGLSPSFLINNETEEQATIHCQLGEYLEIWRGFLSPRYKLPDGQKHHSKHYCLRMWKSHFSSLKIPLDRLSESHYVVATV